MGRVCDLCGFGSWNHGDSINGGVTCCWQGFRRVNREFYAVPACCERRWSERDKARGVQSPSRRSERLVLETEDDVI